MYAPGGAGNTYIQRLDTTTGVIDSIRVLSFSPRCLVAKNKWVCCGGEYGEFTATRIDDDEDAGQPRSLHNLSRGFRLAKSKRMGKERVNCITLWFPPARDDTFVGAYDQPVAVLANNDKTVTIVNLPEWEATVGSELMPELEEDEPSHDSYRLDVLKYPDFVNRAVISPDGRLLAAISDDPYLYIHERADKHAESPKAPRTRSKLDFHWKLLRKIYLKSQRLGDETSSRGSFAVCFSGSGRYLAVGTQYGMISVFDVAAFYEPGVDPFLTAFTSSRPNSEQGAVRDMAFCPGPYDLLAWTEDRGRFGVADLRRNFLSRQIETLNSSADGLEHVRVQRDASGSSRLAEGARTGSTRGAEWTPERYA